MNQTQGSMMGTKESGLCALCQPVGLGTPVCKINSHTRCMPVCTDPSNGNGVNDNR